MLMFAFGFLPSIEAAEFRWNSYDGATQSWTGASNWLLVSGTDDDGVPDADDDILNPPTDDDVGTSIGSTINAVNLVGPTRTVNNFTFSNNTDSWSLLSSTSATNFTINGLLSKSGSQSLTFRRGNSVDLNISINQLLLTGGTLSLGSNSASQYAASVALGQTDISGGTLGITVGSQSASDTTPTTYTIGALTVETGGIVSLRSDTGTSIAQVQSLAGAAANAIVRASSGSASKATLQLVGSANTSYAGTLVNGNAAAATWLALEKSGTGTQTLSGVNTYTGGTQVTGGILRLGASNTLAAATGDIQVKGTGTLDSSVATATLGGAVILSETGNLSANADSIGSFSLASGKSFTMTGGTLTLQLGDSFDQLISGGGSANFAISGGTFALDVTGLGFDYTDTFQVLQGFTGVNSVNNLAFTGYDTANYAASLSETGVLSFAPVPEPGVAVMGMVGLVLLYRRRRD